MRIINYLWLFDSLESVLLDVSTQKRVETKLFEQKYHLRVKRRKSQILKIHTFHLFSLAMTTNLRIKRLYFVYMLDISISLL